MKFRYSTASIVGLCVIMASAGLSSAQSEILGQSCAANGGANRALCVAMIGGVREAMRDGQPNNGFKACSPNDPNDLEDTYAVIDWIRAHPERQGDDLGLLTEEILSSLHPCSN